MSEREALDKIAAIVEKYATYTGGLTADCDLVEIARIIKEQRAAVEAKAETRAEWATEVEAAAKVATATGTNLGRKLGLLLDTGASFVRHGSDLGGGLMPYRFKSLAAAVVEQAAQDKPEGQN